MPLIKNNQILCITQTTASLPAFVPTVNICDYDSVIINSVTYDSITNSGGMYFLYCTYTNCYVASFNIKLFLNNANAVVPIGGSVTPNLEIQLNNPSMPLTFRLFYMDLNDDVIKPVDDGEDGMVNIVLSFIKY